MVPRFVDHPHEQEEFLDYPNTGTMKFLFESYTQRFYYFEVFECIRRLFLSSMVS